MPYDSLVALGNSHPQSIVRGADFTPVVKPIYCARPPSDKDPKPAEVSADQFIGPPAKMWPSAEHLCGVKLTPGLVQVHAMWRQTPFAGAIDGCGQLDLTAITPAMLRTDTKVTRSLLNILGEVSQKVEWCDARGLCHRRRPFFGLPIGPRWAVNGATALAMCMASSGDPTAFREILLDGLLVVVDQLQGSGSNIFSAHDVAYIIKNVIAESAQVTNPADSTALLAAAGTLVSHFIQQVSREHPDGIRQGIEVLSQTLCSGLPRDAEHMGLSLGIILSGAFKYVGVISFKDYRGRWRIASLANIIWASTSFIPIPVASGAVATSVVASAIWWDYFHPPRDFDDVVRRFECELMHLALRRKLPILPEQVGELRLFMAEALTANSFAG